jgi:hypothetical protein
MSYKRGITPTHQIPSICFPVRGRLRLLARPFERSYTYSWTFDMLTLKERFVTDVLTLEGV